MKKNKLVSIIIVNYNGLRWLKRCLDSVYKQSYKNFEIIFVDNNSKDESIKYVRNNYPDVIVVENKENSGFAGGNNIGVDKAHGEFYFLVNNDTDLIDQNLIKKSINFLEKNRKIGSLQPKICLLDNPEKIDLCGSFWTPTTILYHYGFFQNQNESLFNKNFPVFTCKGAAMFIRKECVDEIGLFDPDFWCYYEETDFSHRAWLAGWESWYFCEAKILHSNGGTSSTFDNSFIQFHSFKNKLRSFIKNFSGVERVSIILKFTVSSIIFGTISLFMGKPKNIKALFSAYAWNIRKVFSSKNEQKELRRIKKIPNKVIRKPSFNYYLDLIIDLRKHNYKND